MAELMTMLASARANDVVYAIHQLDQLSGGRNRGDGLSDFDRKDVLAAVRGLMTNPELRIARAAIALVGSHNPYMSDEWCFPGWPPLAVSNRLVSAEWTRV